MYRLYIFKVAQYMSVLHVAQKNRSIAKEVANILSNSRKRVGFTLSKYNPIYEFDLNNTPMKFTSVRGHIFDYELPQQCSSWQNYDNKKILKREQVPLLKVLGNDMNDVVKNIQKQARQHKQLVLWLDCDREGQAIAFEVLQICQKVNPKIKVKRARFAAVTPTDVWNAYNNLVNPNHKQADAVNFRIQIDFRMGCTFTRYQTTLFQQYYQMINKTVISYGPCQMPTLSFVVDRYLQIKYFKPEKYWVIEATCIIDENTGIPFKWSRKNTKDEAIANALIIHIMNQYDQQILGTVIDRKMHPKKRYRPYPLTTVNFQKLATDKLKMSSAKAMEIAQKLYQKGFISYPRTQTNAFPKTINLKQLIGRLSNSDTYNQYIDKLLNQDKYMNPKVGNKDDQAHTPIHPVKLQQLDNLAPDQRKVYDLICRHFLACCSKDANGQEYQVRAEIGGQQFKASYLSIKQKNYLQIYPYDKWTSSSFPAQIPEKFPVQLDLKQSKTTPPGYLTQSELIDTMEKNQIGTDSTIHEHIETIQKRQYAIKTNNTFKPTNLGASLIQAYRKLHVQLPQCQIRRKIQNSMNKIAEGQMGKLQATNTTLLDMQPLYDTLQNKRNQWIQALKQYIEEFKELKNVQMQEKSGGQAQSSTRKNIQACKCPKCSQPTYVRYSPKTQGHFVGCSQYPNCKWIQSLPDYIQQVQQTDSECRKCGNKMLKVKAKENFRIDQMMMRIRFSQQQNLKLELCMTPNCDQFFEQSRQQKSFKRQRTIQDDQSQNASTIQHNKRANSNYQVPTQSKRQIRCYKCQQIGHIAPNCPKSNYTKKQQKSTSRNYSKTNNSKFESKSTIKCYICSQPGHIAPNCPNKGKQMNKTKTQNPQKIDKPKKICPECGIQGRHPNNSNCSKVKRKNHKNQNSNLDE